MRIVPKTYEYFVREFQIFIAKRGNIYSTLRFKGVICLFSQSDMTFVKISVELLTAIQSVDKNYWKLSYPGIKGLTQEQNRRSYFYDFEK
jgi:hypothetical protein